MQGCQLLQAGFVGFNVNSGNGCNLRQARAHVQQGLGDGLLHGGKRCATVAAQPQCVAGQGGGGVAAAVAVAAAGVGGGAGLVAEQGVGCVGALPLRGAVYHEALVPLLPDGFGHGCVAYPEHGGVAAGAGLGEVFEQVDGCG